MRKTRNRGFVDSKGTEALFNTFNTPYYYYYIYYISIYRQEDLS